MLIMPVEQKGNVYATSPSNAKNETSKNSDVPVQSDASVTYTYTYTLVTQSITKSVTQSVSTARIIMEDSKTNDPSNAIDKAKKKGPKALIHLTK